RGNPASTPDSAKRLRRQRCQLLLRRPGTHSLQFCLGSLLTLHLSQESSCRIAAPRAMKIASPLGQGGTSGGWERKSDPPRGCAPPKRGDFKERRACRGYPEDEKGAPPLLGKGGAGSSRRLLWGWFEAVDGSEPQPSCLIPNHPRWALAQRPLLI